MSNNCRPPKKEESDVLIKYIDSILESFAKENEFLFPLEDAVKKSILFGTSKVKIRDVDGDIKIEV